MAATTQPPQWSCTIVDDGAATVIRPTGELDLATVGQLREAVDAAIAGRAHVVIDLARLTFLDSSGLHCLMTVANRARRAAVRLELLPGTAPVMHLFELTCTLELLPFRSPS